MINGRRDKVSWNTNDNNEVPLLNTISSLNFFKIINRYATHNPLFQNKYHEELAPPITKEEISFPIYEIDYNKYEIRRKALHDLKSWVYDNLYMYYDDYDFILPQLASIINEIAKNGADHTTHNAYIGMDVSINHPNNTIKISFSIGDLGIGINQNIRNHASDDIKKRLDNWDLTQTYREALSPGFTTKKESKDNKGMGMSLILDGAQGMNLNLSVFDANSRGILNLISTLVHSEIRKNFFNIGKDTGFFYFGEIEAKKIIK